METNKKIIILFIINIYFNRLLLSIIKYLFIIVIDSMHLFYDWK